MSGWTYAFLEVVVVVMWTWPVWAALVLAQAVTLFMGLGEMRWLPTEVLGLGVLWCVARLVLFK